MIKKRGIWQCQAEQDFAAMEEKALGVESVERLGSDAGSREKAEVVASSASVKKPEGWIESVTDDGQTYYYNTVTGVAQWERPEGFQEDRQMSEATEAKNEKSSSCPGMEVSSSDKYSYYDNTETGESSWEKPEEYSPLEEADSLVEKQERRDPASPRPEPFSGDKDSLTDRASDVEEPDDFRESPVPKREEEKNSQSSGNGEVQDTTDDDDDYEEDKPALPDDEEEEETPAKRARKTSPYVNREQTEEEQGPTEPGDLLEVKVKENTESTREVGRKRKMERKAQQGCKDD